MIFSADSCNSWTGCNRSLWHHNTILSVWFTYPCLFIFVMIFRPFHMEAQWKNSAVHFGGLSLSAPPFHNEWPPPTIPPTHWRLPGTNCSTWQRCERIQVVIKVHLVEQNLHFSGKVFEKHFFKELITFLRFPILPGSQCLSWLWFTFFTS